MADQKINSGSDSFDDKGKQGTGKNVSTGSPTTPTSSSKFGSSTGADYTKTPPGGSTGTTGAKTGSTSGSALTGAGTAPAKSFVDQAKATAGQAYEAVSEKAVNTLDEKKSTLAGGLSTVADTIRQAGDSLAGSASENALADTAAKYASTAANKLESATQYFEQNDIKSVMRDFEGFARRNPAIFLGAAFAAGVLLARFLKAEPTSYNRDSRESFGVSPGQGIQLGDTLESGKLGSSKFGTSSTQGERLGSSTTKPGGEFGR